MALTINEGTSKETMANIPGAGFPVGYANMMRVTIDANGNFTADVRRYYSEVEREANPDQIPGLIGIGAQIPKDVKDQVFGLIYPYLEDEINRLAESEEDQA